MHGVITSLSTGDNVMTKLNCWNAVLLDGGGNIIACKLDILQHDRVQAGVIELANGSNTNITLLVDVKGSEAAKCQFMCLLT